ncbi:hypothetical protein BSKO_08132 [Bryopsis sp. KO-2023]|nr:hypothetical protein BSKO_08132 [Bryopsis sp. KO-2023]
MGGSPFESPVAQKVVCDDLSTLGIPSKPIRPPVKKSPFAQPPAKDDASASPAAKNRDLMRGCLFDWELVQKMGSSMEDMIKLTPQGRTLQPTLSSKRFVQ